MCFFYLWKLGIIVKKYIFDIIILIYYETGTIGGNLITGEFITAKKTNIILFKESSAFYELCKDDIINNEIVEITSDYLNYINNWDGEKHYKTLDLAAGKKTNEEYQKKFGGK